MAKVMVFLRCEMFSGEAKRNEEFRKIIKEFVPYILEGEISLNEYCVNTKFGFENAFKENPDCKIVFTAENDFIAQYEASKRNKLVFEWRCFNSRELVPVRVEKDNINGITQYRVIPYGVQTSI